MLIITADRLDAAAAAIEFAAEGLFSADGRTMTGPQLSRSGYANWLLGMIERTTRQKVRRSDDPALLIEHDPKDTWP